jgi:hypothetical protein
MKKKYDYVAYYQPAGNPKLTKRFSTKKLAEEYILSKCCDTCKKEGLFSSCGSEWLVIRYDKYLKADNHFDLMRAAGWRRIK